MSWIRLQSANSLPVMHFLVHACTTTPPCVESLPRATIIFCTPGPTSLCYSHLMVKACKAKLYVGDKDMLPGAYKRKKY